MQYSPLSRSRVISVAVVQKTLEAILSDEPANVAHLLETLAKRHPHLAEDLHDCAESVRGRIQRESMSNRDLVIETLQRGPATLKEVARATELSVNEARAELVKLVAEGKVGHQPIKGLAGKGGDRKTLIYSLR